MSDNEKALSWIEKIAAVAAKVFESRMQDVVRCRIATVVSINNGIYTVRLLSSPADGSEDFTVSSKTTDTITAGDAVYLYYVGDLTNAYIAMRIQEGS